MFVLCVLFMIAALFSIEIGAGFMSAIFLIISAICYLNHVGGGPDNDDDQRMA